jgi:hypothetical protein
LVPDDLNHCVRVAFLNDDRTDFLNDDIKKIVNRVWEDVQHKDNSSVTLEFAPTGTAATWPFQIFIQFDVEFQSGAFLDEKKEAIASFDLNKTIADRVAWICLTPIASAASTITIEASDLAVADIRGRALVTFGGKRLKLERVKKDANLWCAPIGGTGDTPVSISNDGLATDDVHLLYRGTEYGDRIAPRHWNVRVLVKPYAVAGVSLPMCDDCRRSFIPANVTTVRAIFPIVQFAGGWPKVFEARVDLGISPGLLIAQNSASSAMGLGLAPLGGLCFAIDAGASPRVCGFATLDFVGVSATKAGDTSATIKFAVQPNAMAVLGLSL